MTRSIRCSPLIRTPIAIRMPGERRIRVAQAIPQNLSTNHIIIIRTVSSGFGEKWRYMADARQASARSCSRKGTHYLVPRQEILDSYSEFFKSRSPHFLLQDPNVSWLTASPVIGFSMTARTEPSLGFFAYLPGPIRWATITLISAQSSPLPLSPPLHPMTAW